MDGYDVVVRGGTVVMADGVVRADIGIVDGRIVALAERLQGTQTVDAGGLLVLPGGVDTHCHIEQLHEDGGADEETWESGTTSALLGGTTSVISFSAQFKGQPIRDTLAEYRQRAERSLIDYSFHQIITDPTDTVVVEEIPRLVESGIRSLKVFLTYDPLHLDDRQFLRVLAAARRVGALVSVHCENHDAIAWRTEALLAAGLTGPKYHAWSRPRMVEREATHRAIALAELVDQPIQVFHVSCPEVADEISRARQRGLKVWGETCPQYLVLSAADMDRPGLEGAKFMCSPPPRDAHDSEALWAEIARGTLDVVSSDHSGWSFEGPRGKRAAGADAGFPAIPNGVPGLATRLPLLFSEGVGKGRIDLPGFARLVATNPARLFGLHPRKGTIGIGSDADLVLWDPEARRTLTNAVMGHTIDHTPYEGREVTGWPVLVMRRGVVMMRDGVVMAGPGGGRFLPREPYSMIRPSGRFPDNFDASSFLS